MQYVMLMLEGAGDFAKRNDPHHAPAYWGAWSAYAAQLRQAGVMVAGNGLQPPETATTLRRRGGVRQVQDGPFADTKELLGGYFVIEVADLDAALDWAEQSPLNETSAVEIRPVLVNPG